VQVFAIDRNGDEVVLAQLKELDHVGEQSLLPGRPIDDHGLYHELSLGLVRARRHKDRTIFHPDCLGFRGIGSIVTLIPFIASYAF
jgi:hypothetical protein